MLTRLSVITLALSLLASCATTGKHAGFVGTAPAAQQQKTVVTVIYPRAYPAGGGFDVYQEDAFVGSVAPGSYLVWETTVPPDGRLHVAAKGFENDIAILRPEASQPAFLKVQIGLGVIVPTMQLLPATRAEAEAFMQKGKGVASAD